MNIGVLHRAIKAAAIKIRAQFVIAKRLGMECDIEDDLSKLVPWWQAFRERTEQTDGLPQAIGISAREGFRDVRGNGIHQP